MRLFVAVEVEAPIRQRLSELVERMRISAPSARFVGSDGLHVTLKFLGQVSEATSANVKQALSAVSASAFELEIAGLGFFPNSKRPTVFWAGVRSSPEQALGELAKSVDEACAALGFPREVRPYRPHVTLARFRPGSVVRDLVAKTDGAPDSFGRMTVSAFHLYESRLRPTGAIYEQIASFTLTS